MTSVLAELARTFAMLSLVSIGGINVLLPEIRRQVVNVHGWMMRLSPTPSPSPAPPPVPTSSW